MYSKRTASWVYAYFKPHHNIDVVPADMDFKTYLKKWWFLKSGYNKLGLYHDDLIYEWPHVHEAVRRLPRPLKEERDWRLIRSIQLDLNHQLLAPEMWTTFEEDISKGRYLQPFIEEVEKEWKEKDVWNSVY